MVEKKVGRGHVAIDFYYHTYVRRTGRVTQRSVVSFQCQGGTPEIFSTPLGTARSYPCVSSCIFQRRCTNPDTLSARILKPRRSTYSPPLLSLPPRRIRISGPPNACSLYDLYTYAKINIYKVQQFQHYLKLSTSQTTIRSLTHSTKKKG